MNTRQDFEEWAEGRYSTWKASDGSYVYDETQAACFAWEAATARQEAKVKALEQAIAQEQKPVSSCETCKHLHTTIYDYPSSTKPCADCGVDNWEPKP